MNGFYRCEDFLHSHRESNTGCSANERPSFKCISKEMKALWMHTQLLYTLTLHWAEPLIMRDPEYELIPYKKYFGAAEVLTRRRYNRQTGYLHSGAF